MDLQLIGQTFLDLCEVYRMWKQYKGQRRWKIRPLNNDWMTSGYQRKVFLRMKEIDPEQFFVQTIMSRALFEMLLTLVGKELKKPKQRIDPEERLSITLHYLAHGVSIKSLAWMYKIGRTTVRGIVLETCEVLWRLLSPIYVSEPSERQYQDIALDFKSSWNMPNCVGAIDGKHIAIKCPPKSGSLYFNYKKFSSIVLMAACDAKYTLIALSAGSYGSQSDGGILRSCPFGEALIADKLPFPQAVTLSEESRRPFPHFFVEDAAFPLRKNLMRPYPGANLTKSKRICNYRLSRARRCIENAFGVLTARWRILRNTIEFLPENCESIVLACVALHNFVMLNDHARWYCPESYVDWEGPDHVFQSGTWRAENTGSGSLLRPFISLGRLLKHLSCATNWQLTF